jgi:hypothetical protein
MWLHKPVEPGAQEEEKYDFLNRLQFAPLVEQVHWSFAVGKAVI